MNDDYLAGFIDGEGCFSISRISRPNTKISRYPYYRAVFCIGNTNLQILEDIQEYLDGGWVTLQYKPEGRRKPAYLYQLTGKKALEPFIIRMLPRLRIKREVASVLLDFFSGVATFSGSTRLPEEESIRREHLILRVRELNRKGIHLI
jgi:hypothetical protein